MYGFSGISPEVISRIWVDENYVVYGTWLSTIGVISWLLGFSILEKPTERYDLEYTFKYSKLLNFTIILFILFLLSAGKDFLTGGVYKGSGGGSAGEGISAYLQLLFSICIIILTVFVIIKNKNSYQNNLIKWIFNLNKKYLVLFFSYIILFFLIGDRGGPLALLLSFLILIGSFVRPIKFFEVISLVFIGTLILTLIGLGRSEKSGLNIFSAGAEKFEFTSGYDNTLELANSVRTLYRAISEVPKNHDYFYGKLWMSDLLASFPFTQSFYLNLTNTPSYEISSSGYITYLTFGKNPHSGEGTSLIADIYLNYGLFGICLFMFILGIFFKKVENEIFLSNNVKWIIIGGILASMSISFSRNGLFLMVRPVIWGLMLSYLLVKKYRVII